MRIFQTDPASDSPDGVYLGSLDGFVYRSGISHGTQNGGLTKSGGSEFLKEGYTFLGARDSGKPIILTCSIFVRELLPEYQFSRKHRATGS